MMSSLVRPQEGVSIFIFQTCYYNRQQGWRLNFFFFSKKLSQNTKLFFIIGQGTEGLEKSAKRVGGEIWIRFSWPA
jgi:hypothetical protein